MTARGGVAAFGLLALLAGPAQAGFFYTADLGGNLPLADCLGRAQATLDAYVAQSGSSEARVQVWSWSVEALGLRPGGIDAQITCPYRDGMVQLITLVLHVDNAYAANAVISDEIAALWEATPAPQPAPPQPAPAQPAPAQSEPAPAPAPEPAPAPAPAPANK